MKKLLFAFALIFFAGFSANTAFAATLKGTITDPIQNLANLKKVKVTLGTGEPIDSDGFGFEFTDFTPKSGMSLKFEYPQKDKYYTLDRTIVCSNESIEKNSCDYVFNYNQLATNDIIEAPLIFDKANDTYTLNIEMFPVKKEIIKGKIVNPDNEPLENAIIKTEVIDDNSFSVATEKTDANGKFTIMGYRGTAKKPREYNLKITHKFYFGEKTYPVEVKAGLNELVPIELKNKTRQKVEEENREAMTGFDCSELMPKYLVGANCEENRKLKGDATDIALWIQKFGGNL